MLSTVHPAAAASGPAPSHRPALPGRIDPCPAHARRTIVRSIAADLPARVLRDLDHDARDGRHPGCHVDAHVATVIGRLGDAFIAAGESGRLPNPREVRVFRVLGVQCALRGPDSAEVVETLDAAAEVMHTLVLIHAARHETAVGQEAALAVGASLCGVIETVSRLAFDDVVAGYDAARTWQPADPATRTAFNRLLDGPDDDVDTVMPPAGCDVRIARAVALLVSRSDAAHLGLLSACNEAEVLVPHAIAVGSTTAGRPHGRVVIEYRSREDWRQARARIRAVADAHGLWLVTTDPVIGLGRLRTRYHSQCAALARLTGPAPGGPDSPSPGSAARPCSATAGGGVLIDALPLSA